MNIEVIFALICNAAIVFLTIYAHYLFQKNIEKIHPGKSKWHFFIYFTSDSNILNALFSAILIPYLIRALCAGGVVPQVVYVLHYVGTCAVLLTFLTVMVFLAPVTSYKQMLSGSDMFMHLVCPLLSLVSCAFLTPAEPIPFYYTFLGIIPTIVYGAVYCYKVLVKGPENGGWEDFYTFNRGGKWYISLCLMLIGSYLISVGLYFLGRL